MHPALTALSFLAASSLTKAQSSMASSVLPTLVAPTPTSIGNASDIQTYPICAQTCANETAPSLAVAKPGCDPNNLSIECACSDYYRSETAACEKVTCSDSDYQTTQSLAQQLCGPLYSGDSALSTSVASAIASSTAVAAASVAGKNIFNLSSYPACAQDCTLANDYGGCGAEQAQNTTCICNPPASIILGNCEVANCSPSDLEIVTSLSYQLCAPVGGVNQGENLTGVATSFSNGTSQAGPSPIAFTGGTAQTTTNTVAFVAAISLGLLMSTLVAC